MAVSVKVELALGRPAFARDLAAGVINPLWVAG
jgi:hypothetical protein